MKRRVEPARANRVGYPRLSALLVGAAPLVAGSAFADATIPVQGHTTIAAPAVVVAPPPPQPPQPNHPTPPTESPPPPHPVPPLGGKVACPRIPKESNAKPDPKADPKVNGKKRREVPLLQGLIGRAQPPSSSAWQLLESASLDEGAIVIHPHGPDEPCEVVGRRA